jgi:hypothetical protein
MTKRMEKWLWFLGGWALVMLAIVMLGWGNKIPPQVPLFYSRPWGEDQLADKMWLWIPAGIAGLVALFETVIIRRFKPEPVLGVLILGTGLLTQIILILATVRIIFLVV